MIDPDLHPVDRLLRQAAGDPTPTPADRRRSEQAFNRAISKASLTRKTEQPRRRWAVPALAGSLLVLGLAIVALQLNRTSSAAAALTEIAAAAELTNPMSIPAQSYAYTESNSTFLGVAPPDGIDGRSRPLAYLLPLTRETWIGSDGAFQIRTTAHTPVFFSAGDETDYYTAGQDTIDRINVTVTATGTGLTSVLDEQDWPTTPGQLMAAITQVLPDGRAPSQDAAIVGLALDLIRETAASPELRAAVLRLMAALDDIVLTQRLPDGGGTFNMTYDQPQPTSLTFTLSGDGALLHVTVIDIDGDTSLGIPPNTIIEDSSYRPTRTVNSLDTP